MQLDHLAICAADLATGVAWAEDRLGVALGPAGGTRALARTTGCWAWAGGCIWR